MATGYVAASPEFDVGTPAEKSAKLRDFGCPIRVSTPLARQN